MGIIKDNSNIKLYGKEVINFILKILRAADPELSIKLIDITLSENLFYTADDI